MNGRWRTTALAEVTTLVALLLSYIWGWHGIFRGDFLLVTASYFGVGYLSHVRRGESARDIGLRFDNWWAAVRNASLVVSIGVCVPLAVGAALGTWHFHSWSRLLAGLPWGVAWGTAQQYGLLCFLYRRLVEILDSERGAAVGAGTIFAVLHVPNPLLLGVTFVAGIVSCMLYRRVPNVFVLGMAHAAISVALYGALPYSITHGLRVGPGYFAH